MNRKLIAAALSGLLVAGTVCAEAPTDRVVRKQDQRTDVRSTLTYIDANQLDMFVTNEGNFAYDISNARGKADGLYFPNTYPNSDKTIIYDAGLWVGGVRGGDTLVVVAEYSSEFTQGALGTDATDPNSRVYKIFKNHVDKVAEGFMVQDKNMVLGDDPNAEFPLTMDDYNGWIAAGGPVGADGTPWINELGADQMTFAIYNDGDPSTHTNDAASTDPIGLTVKQTTFAFNRSDALGNVIFMKFEVIYDANASGNLENAYISLWADPDLGGAGDDFVGCNPDIGLGYCYNATNNDNAYGAAPPAVGFDFFQGPSNNYNIEWPPSSGLTPEFLPMTSFNKYINGTDPHSKTDTYNYMQGLQLDGSPLSNGTTFAFPGDPVTGTGEIDSDPADRRYMQSAGPFFMAPGDTNVVVAAVVSAQGSNRLSSITFLRFVDTFAQSAFDANFIVPQPPAIPDFTLTSELPNKVSLVWDGAAEEDPGSYAFQGYNVWQGQGPAGPWTRLATYDINDGVATIFQEAFDPETGEIYSQPLQFGTDFGVNRHIQITSDAYTWDGNVNLINNHPYYFAVSAYSYDGAESPNNLESAKRVVTLIPNSGVTGTNWTSTFIDTVTHVTGGSDGVVGLEVIDEGQLKSAAYSVTYYDTTWIEVDTSVDPADTTTFEEVWWRVKDTTNNTSKAVGVAQAATEYPDFVHHPAGAPIVDGTMIKPQGPPLLGNDWDWTPADGSSSRWLSGVNAGLDMFFGGIGLGVNFFGSELAPADYKKVDIVLTDDVTQWSDCQVYRRDQGYAAAGIGTFPGAAYDVEDPDNPRRLNICYVEMDDPSDPTLTADFTWNPNGSGVGGREYLFIMDSDYNGGVDYDDVNFGPAADCQWACWLLLRGSQTGGCADDQSADGGCFEQLLSERPATMTLIPNYVNTVNDEFTWSTTAKSVTTGESALNSIRAVPNPYYGRSSYEIQSDVKIVKFINMPQNATMKIFNIAGDHIRTLNTDAGSTTYDLAWNLKNEHNVYVASGVYIYFVDAPGYGESFGKVAVFLEEERLKDY